MRVGIFNLSFLPIKSTLQLASAPAFSDDMNLLRIVKCLSYFLGNWWVWLAFFRKIDASEVNYFTKG